LTVTVSTGPFLLWWVGGVLSWGTSPPVGSFDMLGPADVETLAWAPTFRVRRRTGRLS